MTSFRNINFFNNKYKQKAMFCSEVEIHTLKQ